MPLIGRRFTPGLHRAAWGFMQSGDFPVPVLHLKFGENTGTEAKDSSPEGNDGTLHVPTWVKGYLGPGLDFDGLDDYVSVPDDASLKHTSAITIIARIKPDSVAPTYQMIVSKGSGKNELYAYTSSLRFELTTAGGVTKGRTASILVAAIWQEVALTYDGTTYRLYLNGVSKTISYTGGPFTGDIVPGTTDYHIGTRGGGVILPFGGVIDEVCIYDVALSAAQIRQLYLGYR